MSKAAPKSPFTSTSVPAPAAKEPKKRSNSSRNEDGDKENTTEQTMEFIQDMLKNNTVDGLVKFSPRTTGHVTSLQRFYEPLSQLKDEYDNITDSKSNKKKALKKKALKKKIQERIQALLLEAGFQTDSGIVK
jgi:hypothetical protein